MYRLNLFGIRILHERLKGCNPRPEAHLGSKCKISVQNLRFIVVVGFLRGKVVQGEGVFLGNPKDSVWEDWGSP